MEEDLNREDVLLSWLEFSNGEETVKFLESSAMECTGGGDPSEAVLDGMNKLA